MFFCIFTLWKTLPRSFKETSTPPQGRGNSAETLRFALHIPHLTSHSSHFTIHISHFALFPFLIFHSSFPLSLFPVSSSPFTLLPLTFKKSSLKHDQSTSNVRFLREKLIKLFVMPMNLIIINMFN